MQNAKNISGPLAGLLCIVLLYGLWMPRTAAAAVDLVALQKTVQTRFPKIHIVKLAPAPWSGLYEVYTDEEIVYTNHKAEWIMLGQLLDAATQQNVTARSWDDHRRIDYAALPVADAITVVRGTGRRELSVFADPHCPYCRELEQTLDGLDDVTVHVYLYPLESIHPGATEDAARVWCAADRAKTWVDWMVREFPIDADPCIDTPIERLQKLGNSLDIRSTPTLFLADGTRISGVPGKEMLKGMLDRHDAQGVPATAGTPAP